MIRNNTMSCYVRLCKAAETHASPKVVGLGEAHLFKQLVALLVCRAAFAKQK